MKKLLLQVAALMFAALTSVAQAPQKFNYQGIARSATGAPLATTALGLKLSIHDGSASGTVVYAETQTTTTNAYGLYNLAIGSGTAVTGTFAGINWASGNKYLEVAIDPTGGTSYTSLGTNELLSVPYAMYAAGAPATGVTSVTAGTGLSGGTITGTGTISLPVVGTAGTYGSATQVPVITTDAEGRVTTIVNTPISVGAGTVTSVTAGTGLSGGTITGSGTISMPSVGAAGTYGSATQVPVFTTDAQGRVTGVTNTPISVGGSGTVTSVIASAPLTGGTITSTGTIGLSTTGTAGTYGSTTQVPVITTDAYGRVSSATNTTITGLINSGTTNYVSKFTSATALGNSQVIDNGTSVGIGTASPYSGDKLEVINSSSSSSTKAIHGVSHASASFGVTTPVAVAGESDANIGVAGISGAQNGVYGLSSAPTYAGVSGSNSGGGYGVWGSVSGSTGTAGYFDGGTSGANGLLVPNGRSGFGTLTPTNMAKVEISGVGTYSVGPVYQAGLVVDGPTTLSATGVYAEGGWKGVYGHNMGTLAGTEAIGVHGKTEGSTYTGTGYGVKGENTGTGGTANYGVYGIASGATGTGVGGSISGGGTAVSGVITSGTGIAGKFDGGSSGYGVIVPNGISGFGTSTPSNMAKLHVSGVGTYSVAPYYQAGIVADGSSSSASATGVYGESGWKGVYGRNPGTATGAQAIGVHGRSEGSAYITAGYGVLAEAVGTGPTNYGVYGNASGATGNNYGVYGTNTGTGYAGYFSGNVRITGSITKGSGTFLIDHPLDPENKYLYHSFVESPDMMNIYNGNITTDASGDAIVTLPEYFEALNKDFRYQLTVIGTFAQAIVAEKISDNHFKIKTDKPNVEVSWQVTGVRHDKYADAHRVVPEVEKEAQFKGHYLHAEEWGQPHSKSFDAITSPAATEGNKPEVAKGNK